MLQVSHSFLKFPLSLVLLLVLDCSKSMLLLISCLFSFAFLVWSMRVKVSANTFSSLQPWSYREGSSEYPLGYWASNQDVRSLSFLSLYVPSKKKSTSCSSSLLTLCCTPSLFFVFVLLTAWLEKSRAGNSFHLFLQFDGSRYE